MRFDEWLYRRDRFLLDTNKEIAEALSDYMEEAIATPTRWYRAISSCEAGLSL